MVKAVNCCSDIYKKILLTYLLSFILRYVRLTGGLVDAVVLMSCEVGTT